MLFKTLLTFAVMTAVYLWYRTQKTKQADYYTKAKERLLLEDSVRKVWIKPLLYSLAALSVIAGISMYYYSWVDDNTQYQVTITNSQSGKTETFIALKKDMRGRLFITQMGREIWTSDLERIDIKKINAGNN
jgi:ABC-type Fe3+ transport system permease subunit